MTKTSTKSRLSPRSAKKVGPVPAARAHKGAREAPRRPKASRAGPTPAKPKAPRVTRRVQVAKMLKRSSGVTIAELIQAFGVLPHTARAMISVIGRAEDLGVVLQNGRYRAK